MATITIDRFSSAASGRTLVERVLELIRPAAVRHASGGFAVPVEMSVAAAHPETRVSGRARRRLWL